MKILVTGTAGFIGFHLTGKLLKAGHQVVGLDSINDYYDVRIKKDRLKTSGLDEDQIEPGRIVGKAPYRFIQLQLENHSAMNKLFEEEKFDTVIHLAAQAGVRYSLVKPHAYTESNITGFINILECSRHHKIKHLVYASSSSVYGLNATMPFSTHHNVDHPVSLYAASKKANELMAHTYSHLYGLPTTGLRFFTVYGPWGRPDMALFIFVKKILSGEPIDVYNSGQMRRDFTYIDDIVQGIVRVHEHIPTGNKAWDAARPDPASSPAPYKIYNIGRNQPVELMDFIREIEKNVGRSASLNYMPIQPGDVVATYADCSDLEKDTGYRPTTGIDVGVKAFVEWYRAYYGIK